jgi:single-strand DNA-binding protein
MELQGQIIKIGETEVVGQKGFKKRQIVIKTDTQYPQTIPVDFTQDKTGLLDMFKLDEFVTIGINIQGNEWNGKYFANIQGWKISKGEKEKSASSFMPGRTELNGDMANQFNASQEDDNDLPF